MSWKCERSAYPQSVSSPETAQEPRATRAHAHFQFHLPVDWQGEAASLDPEPFFVPVGELAGHARELVDFYLRHVRLTCCSFRAGYRVDIDGRFWLDGVDEPWMSMNWVRAVSELLGADAKREAQTFVWEESQLQLRRDGDWLRIVDCAAPALYPPTWVPFRDFVRDLWLGASAFERLANEVVAEIARRGVASEALAELRKVTPPHLPTASQAELEKLSQIEHNFVRACVDLNPLKDFLGVI